MYYVGAAQASIPDCIDLRSDTVTKPTRQMRAVMAEARVGDDVYAEDATVNQLQEYAADLLGKEAALFFSSGTQANLCAMLAHCQRGEEALAGDQYHTLISEAGGASVLGGIVLSPLPTDRRGALTAEAIDQAVKPDDPHCPISKLLSLENTVSGHVQSVEQINAWARQAHRHHLRVHLDGARLFNAVIAAQVRVTEMVQNVDSVSVCLSKGLGAPVGTVLAGDAEFIRRARRLRKMLGGGMRQAGILAAAGLYALKHHIDRLAEDHAHARHLARALATVPQLSVEVKAVETNMVFIALPMEQDGRLADQLRAYLAERNILMGGGQRQIRLVTHLDITPEALDAAAQAIRDFFN